MADFLTNVSLKEFNTFGFEVKAEHFVKCTTVEEIREAIGWAGQQNFPLFILGGGSNVLLTQDVPGLVLKMDICGIEKLNEDSASVEVRVGAGENWHSFVMHALSNDWGGIENLSLIPGTVGAAPMQNIGAYGVEINQVFVSLRALNRETGILKTFTRDDCDFGYRESVFKKGLRDKYIICDVTFSLSLAPHTVNTSYGAIESMLETMGVVSPGIKDISNAVIAIRKSKLPDPAEIGNSGSFFKNPTIGNEQFSELKRNFPEMPGYAVNTQFTKVPAGWLIEQCGWKGYEKNGVGVHRNQALVLVNYGTGSGRDVEKLSKKIRQSVREKFGIELHPEVNIH